MSGKPDRAHSDKSAYRKALQKIRDATARGETTIDFYNGQLTALAPEISGLKNLTWLYRRRNQLTSLPPEIGQLKNLTRLYLRSNQLTSLPPEIGGIERLEQFDVANNPLKDPPPEVARQGTSAILKYLKAKGKKSR